MTATQLIPKESLNAFHFTSASDVLQNLDSKKRRQIDLEKALILGNGYQGKVKITLVTADNQVLAVQTTIWSVSDNHVTLKGGTNIPVSSIYSIEF
jgi:hypothetical protein